jgi:hypothetical protein
VDHACEAAVTEPIPVKVTRYRCTHCPRTGAVKARIQDHIGRCWLNPAARGCKTCKHFEPCGPEWSESCGAGISLTGRPECDTCKGRGQVYIDGEFGGVSECPECGGDGAEIKRGPVIGCHEWEECVRYFCPASGATECCGTHGGWDTCCDRPDLHRPTQKGDPR